MDANRKSSIRSGSSAGVPEPVSLPVEVFVKPANPRLRSASPVDVEVGADSGGASVLLVGGMGAKIGLLIVNMNRSGKPSFWIASAAFAWNSALF